jgi:oligoribonuclease
MLVWMDLEMTGLDPRTNVIVEIATIVTDDELEITAIGPDLVIHCDEIRLAAMDPVVVDMHTRSGLLEKIRGSEMDLAEAGRQTFEFIKQWVPQPRTVPLCGNSIGMDRRFLNAYLPEIEEWLHYRSVDVSSVKELVKRWYPTIDSGRPNKAGTHRALDDVMASIEELRYYRRTVFNAATAVAEKLSPTSNSSLT